MNHFCCFLALVTLPVLALASEFECDSSSDCPKYNYCAVAWCAGRRCGGSCHSNFDTAIAEGTDCSGQSDPDLFCRRQEVSGLQSNRVWGMDETTATARCTQLSDGTSGCRKAYYMPCTQDSDCPTSFTCNEEAFSDGSANVCVPHDPWNQGEAVPCEVISDCYYVNQPGFQRWEKCERGYCQRLFHW